MRVCVCVCVKAQRKLLWSVSRKLLRQLSDQEQNGRLSVFRFIEDEVDRNITKISITEQTRETTSFAAPGKDINIENIGGKLAMNIEDM